MPSPSRDVYPPEFTDRSRSVLHRVHEAVPDAVLIGGWGTWLRTGGPMSHDIDLIVSRSELAIIAGFGDEVSESHHLGGRKWRGTLDDIHLDLYVPQESRLGRHLQLRVERLGDRRDTVDGWVALDLAAQVATKLAAAHRPARFQPRREGEPRNHGLVGPECRRCRSGTSRA